jgi:dipeptidyl aminopeptidase/acylaminoacyl peptidase
LKKRIRSFSPDGTKIIFRSNRSGSTEIWIADAHGKHQRQLTDLKHSIGAPQFSPDGEHIAIDRSLDGYDDIVVVSTESGAARPLAADTVAVNAIAKYTQAWSADGKEIYFISERAGEKQAWRIPASGGGEAVQLPVRGALEVAPAPDGKAIYIVKKPNGYELWRLTENGDEQLLPEFAAAGFAGRLAFTPTGFYFLARASDDAYKFKFYDFATRQIKKPIFNHPIPNRIYGNFSLSADGNRVLYALQNQSASNIIFAELGDETAPVVKTELVVQPRTASHLQQKIAVILKSRN